MKNYEKIVKLLGQDTISELDNSDSETLHKVIVQAEESMKNALEELEKNEDYQKVRDQKNSMEQGKKEVFKRQKAKIAYALELLSSRGK